LETKPNFFAILTAEVRYDKELSSTAKLLYAEISALTNAEGFCWANNSYFAELFDCHEKSISRTISLLEKKNYVRTELIKRGYKTQRKIYINVANIGNKNVTDRGNKNVTADGNKNVTDIGNKNVTLEGNKNVTQNNIISFNNINNNNKINSKKNMSISDLEHEFEEVWKLYPRKDGKQDAKKAYIKARKEKTTYEQVENGIKRFIESLKERGTQKEYIPMGSSWFNQRRWEDECSIDTPTKKVTSYLDYYQSLVESEYDEPNRNRKDINYDSANLSEQR
jgi:hypothetical protein